MSGWLVLGSLEHPKIRLLSSPLGGRFSLCTTFRLRSRLQLFPISSGLLHSTTIRHSYLYELRHPGHLQRKTTCLYCTPIVGSSSSSSALSSSGRGLFNVLFTPKLIAVSDHFFRQSCNKASNAFLRKWQPDSRGSLMAGLKLVKLWAAASSAAFGVSLTQLQLLISFLFKGDLYGRFYSPYTLTTLPQITYKCVILSQFQSTTCPDMCLILT